MKTRSVIAIAACFVLTAAGILFAADAALIQSDPDNALEVIASKARNKLQAGAHSASDLADEFKEIDAIAAANRGKPTEAAPHAIYLKAVITLQGIEDLDGAAVLFQQIVKDFPNSEVVPHAKDMLALIQKHREAERVRSSLRPGAKFPDFNEKDLSGQPLALSNYRGKIVLLDFWATWCGPCVRELPNVLAAYKKYHAKGFEIVGISLDDDQGVLEGFLGAKGMSWPQYFDGAGWENKLGQKYGIDSIPATFLLDREGRIVATDLRGGDLEANLSKLLGN